MIYKTNIRKGFGNRLGGEVGCIYELAAMRGDSAVDNKVEI